VTRRDPNIPLRLLALAGALSLALPAAAVARQDEKPPAPTEPETPPAEETEQEGEAPPALPDLDELLGLEPDDDADAGERQPTQEELELERRLNAEEAEDAFKDAVRQMGEVADALRVGRDPGLRTQRVQEDILKKLDRLIEQAEQNPSSSSSQSQSQSQPRPQQRQQQQQQSQQSQSSNAQGDNTSEMTPPGGQQGQLRDMLDAAQAAWGSLPPRVRDVLLQGSSDRFSTLYESMTEEYYRRLAEEGRRP
jgi:hypothetical protein